MTEQAPKQTRPPRWASWLIYFVLVVLMTWPLARHLGSSLGGRDEDMYNVYWGFWWVREALATGQNPYATQHLIYPIGFNLVSFAFSPFLALLWVPFSLIMSPIAAYNVVLCLTILFCCVTMDELVRYLTGNAWAALVAGLTFAFAPRLVAERTVHLNMAMVAWLPWVALLLTRLMREAKLRDVGLLAVSIPLAFLTRMQVGALTVLFAGVYFLGLALVEGKQWHRLALRRLVLAVLLSILLLSPLLVQVWTTMQQSGGESLLRWGAGDLQTDLLAYVLPTPRHPLFGPWTRAIYNGGLGKSSFYWAFVGFVPLILALYAVVRRPRQALPWAGAAVLFFLLALGPYLRLHGQAYPDIRLPFSLAIGLFSAMGFDVPDRFNLALMAAVSVLVGLASAQLAVRPKRSWWLAVVALLILGEYLVVPMPLRDPPPFSPFYETMAAEKEPYAIVDLPLTREGGEVHRYFQTIHHKPIVGGWDHRVPGSAFAFIDGNPLLGSWRGQDDPAVSLDGALAELSQANVRYFVLHKDQLSNLPERMSLPERMRSLLLTQSPVYEDRSVYVLPIDAKSGEQVQITHRFSENLALTRPYLSLSPSSGAAAPQLSANACWYLQSPGDAAGEVRLALVNAEGNPVWERTASLPTEQGLTCQQLPVEMELPFPAGVYQLGITPFSGGQELGTYWVPASLQTLQERSGARYAAMGSPFQVTYSVPMEMLGFDLLGGDGFLWSDIFLQSLAEHQRLYKLTLQLLENGTGKAVAKNTGELPKLEWSDGDSVHDRRILWINDVAPGLYSLGVTLKSPDTAISAFPPSGGPCPECPVTLDIPVLVVPAALKNSQGQTNGQVVAYTSSADVAAEPEQGVSAFGDVAQLTGYSLKRTETTGGAAFDVILYWKATNDQQTAGDNAVFLHLLDGSGQIVAQHDGPLAEDQRRLGSWREGDILVDTHHIECLAPACDGGVGIEVGLYDPKTQRRLPAFGPEGERLPLDRAMLVDLPAQ